MRVSARKFSRMLALFAIAFFGWHHEANAQTTWSNGYAYRRAITIDHTKVPNTDQSNFPVLISGTYSYLATVSNGGDVTSTNGYDIMFTSDAAGTTPLPFEREAYSPSTGASAFWVKITALSHTTDTVIYMFYGNGAVTTDQSNKTGVWNSNYAGVWHMGDSAANTTLLDSTSNLNNGVAAANTSTKTIAGEIGHALSFNGSSDKVTTTLRKTTAFTWEAWLKLQSSSGYESIVTIDGSNYVLMDLNGTSGSFWTADGVGGSALGVSVPTANTWYHLVFVRSGDNASTGYSAYVNGALKGQASSGTLSSGNTITFGYRPDTPSQAWNGSLDEIRISNVARSADWIATEYNNQSSPSTFSSIGAADTTGSGGSPTPTVSSLSPTSGPVTTNVLIAGNNFGPTQGASTVTFNGVQAAPSIWTGAGILARVPSGATSGNVAVTVGGVSVTGPSFTVTNAPGIASISPTSGIVGTAVTITGVNFGTTPGTVQLNGTTATTTNWTDTSFVAFVPSGATSGTFSVTVGGQTGVSPNFTVTAIPTGWLDQDIGATNVAGTASYAGNVFTVKSAGDFNNGYPTDQIHFVYRTFSGDGAIVARILTCTSCQLAGVMIRSSLDSNAPAASMSSAGQYAYFTSRLTTGAGNSGQSGPLVSLPLWLKVTRTGNTLTGFQSVDGENWTQVGTSVTITMGATVYAGLFVSGGGGSTLLSGTFDDVQVTTTSAPGPIIGGISSTTGTVGTSVNVWGSGYGATQLNSAVLVNGAAATVTNWSATAISFNIPSGATTGPIVVSVTPELLDSNPIRYTVTQNPLPSGWLDRDFAAAGGTASYSNNQFTIHGVGELIAGGGGYTSTDGGHFAYQTLSGDGTIVARVVSTTQSQNAGVMMRDSLDESAVNAAVTYNGAYWNFWYRLTANTNNFSIACNCSGGTPPPYWVKLVRSGNAFSPFFSVDGLNWQQAGPSTFIQMGTSIYVGLFSTTGTTVFDNVSIISAASPSSTPAITGLSSSTGSVGSQIIISGSHFGSTQGNSQVLLSDAAMTVNLWSDTSITVTVPSGAVTGPLAVSLAPGMNSSNALLYTVTAQPLANGWYDFPVGGAPGDASYNSGVFTLHSNGAAGFGGGADQFHFVYQPLSTDGTIVARVANLSGASTGMQAGVVIRQTLDAFSADAVGISNSSGYLSFVSRSIPGGASSQQNSSSISLPYWLKLVRSGNTFTAYASPSGVSTSWSQIGTVQMNTTNTVLVGFGVSGGGPVTQITATFDNVSVSPGGAIANPVATGMSPASGPAKTPVTITGTGFGTTVGSVTFNGTPATSITSWSDTSIVALVPDDATSGPVFVLDGNITSGGSSTTTGGSTTLNFNVVFTATVTDSLGNQSTYRSSPFGGQYEFTDSTGSGCSSCNVRGTIQNQYDSTGNRLWVTDELGHTTLDQFDGANNLKARTVFPTRTTPAKTTYAYNSLGEVTSTTDALGNVTSNSYDSHGNLTSVTLGASTTSFGYDSKGELTTITDPLNHVTTIAYNTVGLISSVTDAQSNVTSYGYDSRGNRTSVTDALNHTTTFTFDSGNRLTQITYPDSTTASFAYDSRGRRTSSTDQNSKTTSYTYDDADRLLTVTDAANNVTTYAYDTDSNLTSITDANGHATYFTYDAFGRVTQTNFPSSHLESYSYDAGGNLTSKTDRKGNTIQYVYDGINRLSRKLYPDSTEVDYVYDLVGRIQQVNDPTGTYQFAYDGMSRLTQTTTNYSFLTARSFTTSYSYDAASNRTGFTDPESGSTTYAYDTLNRLQTLTPPSAFTTGSFGFSYDALSRRTQMTRPNNVMTNYTYDNLSRLTSVLHQLSGSTIDGATYTVDNAGNRTAKTDQRTNVTTNYGYDAIYQLLSATQGGSMTESYTYDPVGNRTSSLGVSSYTTNSSNELTATTGASFTYDYNGNTTSKTASSNTTNYAWDYENRLTSVTLPGSGGTVSFVYDPFGRRIKKVSSTGTSIFAYDGDNLIEETNSSGTVVARYSQGLNIDETLATLRSSVTNYYKADGLGSVTSLANGAGALSQTYTFDSFGNQTASTGSLTNPFRYTAREFDSETSLYFMRARYFDSQTGRFINEDPVGFDAGSPNFYVYVGNDPTDGIDPYGLKCIRKLMLVTAYSDPGPGKDWPYFAPKKRGGKPSGAGPGIVAVANTKSRPYPFGSGVSVSNNPDPFGSDNPLAGSAYDGYVHDTGAGWDPNHHNVSPDDWIDIWLPYKQAIKWGKQWRWVTICTPDGGCKSAQSNFFNTYKFGGNAFE